MDWIREEIAFYLQRFVSVEHREYFADDFRELIQSIEGEVRTEASNSPAYELIDDFALVAELGTFIDELKAWLFKIDEIRGQWFYDHITNELPKDYLSVFGYTSPAVLKLDRIVNRARRILIGLKPAKPEQWITYTKKDLRILMGISDTELRRRIKSNEFPFRANKGRKLELPTSYVARLKADQNPT